MAVKALSFHFLETMKRTFKMAIGIVITGQIVANSFYIVRATAGLLVIMIKMESSMFTGGVLRECNRIVMENLTAEDR